MIVVLDEISRREIIGIIKPLPMLAGSLAGLVTGSSRSLLVKTVQCLKSRPSTLLIVALVRVTRGGLLTPRRDRAELLREQQRLRQQLASLKAQLDPTEAQIVDSFEREQSSTVGSVPTASRTYQKLLAEDYVRPPVSLRQFVYDDEYLGKIMRGDVFPKIVDDIETMFNGSYTEVVWAGGIGWGKTRAMEIAVAYDIYKVSCLKDPARAYGMMRGSNITFVNISVTKTQATKVFFQDLYDLLLVSPYFTKKFPFDRNLKSEIRFRDNNVRVYPVAASEQAALGTGVFAACIDEANFMDVIERSKRSVPGSEAAYDQAEAVFHKLSSRMRSRMTQRGLLPGHIYVASSARYPDDFVERLMKKAREEADQGIFNMFTRRYATYDTRPPGRYSSETFRVEVGDLTRRSRVLTGEETNVVEANVITPPVDFKRDFDNDTDRAVRDIAGISVMSIRPFISEREKIARMFELGEEAGLKIPFTKDTVTLQQKDPKMERVLPENLHWVDIPKKHPVTNAFVFENGKQATEKKLFPALYHAHIDLSKSGDATGLCIVHTVGARTVKRFDAKTQKMAEEKKPIIRVDLALRIVPPGKHGEIDIPKVRGILYQLNREFGMQFGTITFDTFGSQESVKTMKDEGFNADTLSVDKDTTPYETLRTALADERILCHYHPVLERELVQLERGEKKIDHPASHNASKDIADALAVFNCEEGWRAGEQNGLFEFGEVQYANQPSPQREKTMEQIYSKVVEGIPLTGQEEDDIIFGGLEDIR